VSVCNFSLCCHAQIRTAVWFTSVHTCSSWTRCIKRKYVMTSLKWTAFLIQQRLLATSTRATERCSS
jgi:hypothetical protein